MENSKHQNPCYVASSLSGACGNRKSPRNAHCDKRLTTSILAFGAAPTVHALNSLDATDTYSLDLAAANDCSCSSVVYCLIEACAVCQGHREIQYAPDT